MISSTTCALKAGKKELYCHACSHESEQRVRSHVLPDLPQYSGTYTNINLNKNVNNFIKHDTHTNQSGSSMDTLFNI